MDNRSSILHCALELFAARGYDAVGVQEVAEAAGVTKPTLYHYFGSKQGLLNALLDLYQEPLNQAVSKAAEYRGDLPLTLEQIARAYFDFARLHPVYYRMQLAMYFAPRDSDAYRAIASRNEEQYRMVEAVFIAAVTQHGNMKGRQRLFAANFVGTLNTSIGLWLNGHLELDDVFVQTILRQFQYGIYS